MVTQDRLEKERADAKNAVEEYVYDMRDKLYSLYEEYVKEEVKQFYSFFPLNIINLYILEMHTLLFAIYIFVVCSHVHPYIYLIGKKSSLRPIFQAIIGFLTN